MILQINSAAERELEEIVAHYDQRGPTAGDRFLTAYRDALKQILGFPSAWPRISRRARYYRIDPFPYRIIYQPLGAEIVVIAIAHTARRPQYWRDRLV